jgi:mannose-6-phosphate isomerase-like protein (cupin superfamily)
MLKLTNLMWFPEGHKDERRQILDITPKIKLFTIADVDGLKLANHYHEKTHESFYCLNGRIYFKLENSKTGERQSYTLEPGQGINIPLFVAHLLLPEKRSSFLGILETDFDPNDLKKYEITW